MVMPSMGRTAPSSRRTSTPTRGVHIGGLSNTAPRLGEEARSESKTTTIHHAQTLHGLPDTTIEERLIKGFKEQIHYLKLENDALQKKLEDPKVENALHTDKLARDLHSMEARSLTLETELKHTKDSLKEHKESFERQAKAMQAEHTSTLDNLRTAMKRAEDADRRTAEVESEKDAIQRSLLLETEKLTYLRERHIVVEKELTDITKSLAFADNEWATANGQKRDAEKSFQEQLALKERHIMDLEAENATLGVRTQGLEEQVKRLEALQMARWLPAEEVPLEQKLQEVQDAHSKAVARVVSLESTLQEKEQTLQRDAIQLDELQQDNARLRTEVASLQQEIDTMKPKVREFENVDRVRQQLQANLQEVQEHLQEAVREREAIRSDRDLLALRLGARLDTELFHALAPEAQPDWIAGTARSLEEATTLLQKSQGDAAGARDGSQKARNEVREIQMRLDNANAESERLERRILEERNRVDELNQKLADQIRIHATFMDKFAAEAQEEAKKLQAEYQEQFQEEFDGLKTRTAELEECVKTKDEEISNLHQVQMTFETLAKFGNLSELGQTIASLGTGSTT